MRLIDADDFGNRMYHEAFEKEPEIIRCKDCKYMIDTGDDLMCDNAK